MGDEVRNLILDYMEMTSSMRVGLHEKNSQTTDLNNEAKYDFEQGLSNFQFSKL